MCQSNMRSRMIYKKKMEETGERNLELVHMLEENTNETNRKTENRF